MVSRKTVTLRCVLYAGGGTGYRRVLTVSPKDEPVPREALFMRERFDLATERNHWDYQDLGNPMQPTGQLRIRIMISEVGNQSRPARAAFITGGTGVG